MQTEVLPADDPFSLPHAVDVLQNGGLVAFPTDTVYGLAAMAFNAEYIEQLYVVKGRNSSRAIAVLINSAGELDKVAVNINKSVSILARRFWPGPLTLIVPRHPNVPEVLSPLLTVGVRVPDHPVALALLNRTGPLAVTSANLSGKQNTTSANEVLIQMGGRIHLILDGGKTPGGTPSTVVDCTSPDLKILRSGPISEIELSKVFNK
ncbi:MAG: L-threonylcarbamoyladenylate synthase [Anaerolineales bacterium]|jgi:L-threonylcarbamoyladenylate synthase